MDDICDTKQEARELTDNIDKVLKTGGFSVKELNLFRKLSTRSGSVGAETFFRPWYPGNNGEVERRNLQVNDVVLVADSYTVRRKWSIGRITEVFLGPDGRVRNVKVKTSAGEYSRPITKVAVIHPAEGEN